MGDFRIVIDTVGGHGQDREKKDGEIVEFGENTPEGFFKKCIEEAIEKGIISGSDTKAKVIHWPLDNYGGQLENNRSKQIVDNLLTGKRTGEF
jgi:hypothetical protein